MRKPLDDALAKNFVHNPSEVSTAYPEILAPTPPKEPTKRFTVDLPESMHKDLSMLAAKLGKSKSDIIKALLQDLLKSVRQ